jgi:hypothetical protein
MSGKIKYIEEPEDLKKLIKDLTPIKNIPSIDVEIWNNLPQILWKDANFQEEVQDAGYNFNWFEKFLTAYREDNIDLWKSHQISWHDLLMKLEEKLHTTLDTKYDKEPSDSDNNILPHPPENIILHKNYLRSASFIGIHFELWQKFPGKEWKYYLDPTEKKFDFPAIMDFRMFRHFISYYDDMAEKWAEDEISWDELLDYYERKI